MYQDICLKVIPFKEVVGVAHPTSTKAIRLVFQMRLPTQLTLICSKLTIKLDIRVKLSPLVAPSHLSLGKYSKVIYSGCRNVTYLVL